MSNQIYEQMSKSQLGSGNMFQQFEQFKRTFSGDPRQIIQQMMNSGRITQAQYDQAVRMANQMSKMIK